MPKYTYNGVACEATRRRPSSRDDKKYMRTVTYQGSTRLVHYGDPNMQMQRDIPERREAFLARHQCDAKKDPFAPGFWACLDWQRTDEKSMNVKADLFDVSQDEYGGVMVAWFPPAEQAEQIAARDGVTVEANQLHVTLAYLGKADDMSDEQIAALILVMNEFAQESEPMSGTLGGVGIFNASESSDGQDVLYANVDVPGLSRFRNILTSRLRGYADISENHDYAPHMTLGYIEPGTERTLPEWETLDIEVDSLTLTVGDKRHSYALDGLPNMAARSHEVVGKSVKAHIKSMDDDTAVVAGYGVIWGGTDLHGDGFAPDTNFMLSLVPTKIVLYDHGYNKSIGQAIIGAVKTSSIKLDDFGMWVEAELDRHNEYAEYVLELVKRGVLGYSSGSVPHLVQRIGKSITQWPIIEFSLTPTPAEPRIVGVEIIKSLAEYDDAFGAFLPEGDGTSPAHDADAGAEEPTQENTQQIEAEKSAGDFEMDNELQEQVIETPANGVAPAVDTDAIVSAVSERVTKSLEAFESRLKKIEEEPVNVAPVQVETKNVNISKTGLGDTWQKAYLSFLREGDDGGLKHLKASNDTDMNIGTAADGGYAVPIGHYQGIIARRDEAMLARQLGVMNIPGKGLTVNVPLDAEADGEFVSTAEAAAFDRDAPALGQAAMTLVKYSKKIELSYELLQDEDSRLMAFLEDFVGRGMAKTHNSLLVTEIAASGTSAKTTAGATAVTAGEIMDLEYALPDEYTDNGAWLMRRATEGAIRQLQGTDFLFQTTPAGMGDNAPRREINGYPVYNAQAMPAMASGTKSIAFLNGNFIGMREEPEMTFLRDPYSKAGTGQVVLHYYFRTVYKVLQAEAVQYLTQAA